MTSKQITVESVLFSRSLRVSDVDLLSVTVDDYNKLTSLFLARLLLLVGSCQSYNIVRHKIFPGSVGAPVCRCAAGAVGVSKS